MYINIQNLFKLPHPNSLALLLVLKQAGEKDLSKEISLLALEDMDLHALKENGYIKYIKGKASQNVNQKMRLDKKGTKFLNDLDTPEVLEEDKKIFDWLAEMYKGQDKIVGNGKATQRHIASFREKTGIEKNCLAFLCDAFIKDDEEQEWSFKLEFVFWKPTNMFQTKFNLEQSRLYQYYLKRQDYFEEQFKTL